MASNNKRQNIRDALAEANTRPRDNRVTDAADQAIARYVVCSKCGCYPVTGSKLRHCGRCQSQGYCSKECAKADWAVHKLICESARLSREENLAMHEAQGGRKKDFDTRSMDITTWFSEVPGLRNEIELLAWKLRRQTPFVDVVASSTDVDGRGIRIKVMPRSFWDADPRFFDIFPDITRETLRQYFDGSSKHPPDYALALTVEHQGDPIRTVQITSTFSHPTRCAQIVEALATGTRAEDLAEAFAFIEIGGSLGKETVQAIKKRHALVDGSATPQDSVPVSTRAINNEVAYTMLHGMDIEFNVRLTGLVSAAHLNGKEGVIRGQDPTCSDRWRVRLVDGTIVSVRAGNFVHNRCGDYKRILL